MFAGLAGFQWHAAQIAPPRDGSHPVIALAQTTPALETTESNLPITTTETFSAPPVDLNPQSWDKRSPVKRRDVSSPVMANTPNTPVQISAHGSLPPPTRARTAREPALEQLHPATLARAIPPSARDKSFLKRVPTVDKIQSSSATNEAAGVQTTVLPQSIFSPHPVYPADALSNGETGRVVLRVQVNTTGRVTAVSIAQSSGSRSLDAAALEAIRRWRFNPATGNGKPVACEVRIPVRFRIES